MLGALASAPLEIIAGTVAVTLTSRLPWYQNGLFSSSILGTVDVRTETKVTSSADQEKVPAKHPRNRASGSLLRPNQHPEHRRG